MSKYPLRIRKYNDVYITLRDNNTGRMKKDEGNIVEGFWGGKICFRTKKALKWLYKGLKDQSDDWDRLVKMEYSAYVCFF